MITSFATRVHVGDEVGELLQSVMVSHKFVVGLVLVQQVASAYRLF